MFCRNKKNDLNTYSETAKEGFHYKVMGSFMFMKSEIFFKCGMMDKSTFLYFEENILAERLKRIGKGVYYYPGVEVVHAHSQTIGKYTSFKRQRNYMFKSGAYYFKTYRNTSSALILLAWLLKEISLIIGKIRRRFS